MRDGVLKQKIIIILLLLGAAGLLALIVRFPTRELTLYSAALLSLILGSIPLVWQEYGESRLLALQPEKVMVRQDLPWSTSNALGVTFGVAMSLAALFFLAALSSQNSSAFGRWAAPLCALFPIVAGAAWLRRRHRAPKLHFRREGLYLVREPQRWLLRWDDVLCLDLREQGEHFIHIHLWVRDFSVLPTSSQALARQDGVSDAGPKLVTLIFPQINRTNSQLVFQAIRTYVDHPELRHVLEQHRLKKISKSQSHS